jgi:hypothetical protein
MRNVNFIEIFGADELAPMQRPLPELPMDNPLWEFRTASDGAADELVKRAELAEFLVGIVGEDRFPPPAPPVLSPNSGEPSELLELMKRSSTTLSRKKIINDKLDAKLYRHDLRERWNFMLEKFAAEGADALPDAVLFRKASAYLKGEI